jgi:hypothetical protein
MKLSCPIKQMTINGQTSRTTKKTRNKYIKNKLKLKLVTDFSNNNSVKLNNAVFTTLHSKGKGMFE